MASIVDMIDGIFMSTSDTARICNNVESDLDARISLIESLCNHIATDIAANKLWTGMKIQQMVTDAIGICTYGNNAIDPLRKRTLDAVDTVFTLLPGSNGASAEGGAYNLTYGNVYLRIGGVADTNGVSYYKLVWGNSGSREWTVRDGSIYHIGTGIKLTAYRKLTYGICGERLLDVINFILYIGGSSGSFYYDHDVRQNEVYLG